MDMLATAVLVAATITTGLTAGLLFAFAHTVMPGLGRADDRTFVAGFQTIDRAISNGWFAATFLGAPAFTALAVVLHLDAVSVLPWLLASLVLLAVMVVITRVVHLPLNEALRAAGRPGGVSIDTRPGPAGAEERELTAGELAAARERFEARWVSWHVVRTVAAVAAFGCLAVGTAVG